MTPKDRAYDQAQARLVRRGADRYQRVDSGQENPKARAEDDRQLSESMPVNGKKRGES